MCLFMAALLIIGRSSFHLYLQQKDRLVLRVAHSLLCNFSSLTTMYWREYLSQCLKIWLGELATAVKHLLTLILGATSRGQGSSVRGTEQTRNSFASLFHMFHKEVVVVVVQPAKASSLLHLGKVCNVSLQFWSTCLVQLIHTSLMTFF